MLFGGAFSNDGLDPLQHLDWIQLDLRVKVFKGSQSGLHGLGAIGCEDLGCCGHLHVVIGVDLLLPFAVFRLVAGEFQLIVGSLLRSIHFNLLWLGGLCWPLVFHGFHCFNEFLGLSPILVSSETCNGNI